MTDTPFDQELLERVHHLDADQKRQVLEFVRRLSQVNTPKGESGKRLIQSIGLFEVADLDEMAQAIEEDCERI